MSNATLTVLESFHLDRGTPEAEQALAIREATSVLHDDLNDRIAILRVVAALKRSPLDALAELQRCEPWASHPAGQVNLPLFEAFMLGAASGGVEGPYERAFLATLAAAPYVTSIH